MIQYSGKVLKVAVLQVMNGKRFVSVEYSEPYPILKISDNTLVIGIRLKNKKYRYFNFSLETNPEVLVQWIGK